MDENDDGGVAGAGIEVEEAGAIAVCHRDVAEGHGDVTMTLLPLFKHARPSSSSAIHPWLLPPQTSARSVRPSPPRPPADPP